MPVDVPEEDWANLQIVFATSDGDVRQNDLSDFTNVKRNGKIAMKLDEGDQIAGVDICTAANDVLRRVHPLAPEIEFLVLTNFATPQYRDICLKAGASHFIDKSTEIGEVRRNLQLVANDRNPDTAAWYEQRQCHSGEGEKREQQHPDSAWVV